MGPNLYDGQTDYSGTSSALFVYNSLPNTGGWARGVLDLGETKDIGKIEIWAGQSRIPHHVKVYMCDSYDYAQNIEGRSDNGLTEIVKFEYKDGQANEMKSTDFSTIDFTLNNPGIDKVRLNSIWNDPGATALDTRRQSISVETSGYIDTSILGNYQITYSAIDMFGNEAEITRNIEVVDTSYLAQYLIMEVYDHHGSDSAAIQEFTVYNENATKIAYTLKEGYDTVTNSVPYNWDSSPSLEPTGMWMGPNLYDGQTSYADVNTSLFTYNGTANNGDWARVVLDLGGTEELSKIELWAGYARIPQYVKVYACEDYDYEQNIKGRNNAGLTEIDHQAFTSGQANEMRTKILN